MRERESQYRSSRLSTILWSKCSKMVYNKLMSIFRDDMLEKLGIKITEEKLDELEKILRYECKMNKIPYTTSFLRTILLTIKRFMVMGASQGDVMMFNGAQVGYAVSVEKLLARLEESVKEVMKRKTDENILP